MHCRVYNIQNPLLETHKIKITCPQTECFTYHSSMFIGVLFTLTFIPGWPPYVALISGKGNT